MNKDKIKKQFIPECALIVYKNEQDYYIESHPIENGIVGAGAPVSEKWIQALAKSFKDKGTAEYKKFELFPDNLLAYHNEPYKKILCWTYKSDGGENLNINDNECRIYPPKMIFLVHNDNLYVFCYKSTKKDKYKLFKAPFYNVYSDGRVCLGNVRIQKEFDTIKEEIEWWTNIWWSSKFTNSLDSNAATIPLKELWRGDNLLSAELEHVLVPIDKTLEQLIKSL